LNHLQKLRPAIEDLCQKHQFKYYTEENDGRILIKFGEGAGHLTQGEASSFWEKMQNVGNNVGYPGTSQPQQSYQQPQQQYHQQYQGQQHYNNQGNQGNQGNDMVEQVVKKAAPFIIRKLTSCCTIM